MLRKLTTSFALSTLLLCSFASAEPLYWKATKGGKELMILGSIHLGKPDMYPLPQPVLQFLDKSDAVILEIDMDSAPTLPAGKQEITGEYLSAIQKQKLSRISKEIGLSDKVLLSQPTWQAALWMQLSYFNQLGYQDQWGVDTYLSNQAKQKGIPLMGLESVDFQLSLFTNREVGRELINDILDNWEENKQVSRCMKDNWLSGDKVSLNKLAEESVLSNELADSFLYSRNLNWANRLDNHRFLPKQGKFLVVVGTLHLIGKQSLIELLEQRGFSLEQLSESEISDCR
ncbi:TraB/GumN family protein [Vibrio sp. JC009]|uniref:TraB/GumN family protein n=1 Tax=Vibrio sp. JC009 TaxID=2912314 RepID=UPI0023B0EE9C|nr:TraB/GumN family protein [Vibrio sp. JC009]WED21126.1 TraB/GumN family protein [Vibrio sp. JC009]